MSNKTRVIGNLTRYAIGGILGLLFAVVGLYFWIEFESKHFAQRDRERITKYIFDEQLKSNLQCVDLHRDISSFMKTRIAPVYSAYKRKSSLGFYAETKQEMEVLKKRVMQCDRLFLIAKKHDIKEFPDLSYIEKVLPEFSVLVTAEFYGSGGADRSESHMSAILGSYEELLKKLELTPPNQPTTTPTNHPQQ